MAKFFSTKNFGLTVRRTHTIIICEQQRAQNRILRAAFCQRIKRAFERLSCKSNLFQQNGNSLALASEFLLLLFSILVHFLSVSSFVLFGFKFYISFSLSSISIALNYHEIFGNTNNIHKVNYVFMWHRSFGSIKWNVLSLSLNSLIYQTNFVVSS